MNSLEKTSEHKSSTSRLPEGWTERLLDRMAAMYGQKFTDQWRGVDPAYLKSVWSEELSGYTVDEIKQGFAACKSRQWPPTLPEFMVLCRPPIDPETAFCEAAREIARRATNQDKWSHPAIYWAAVQMGVDLTNHPYATIKNRWSRILAAEISKGSWDPIPRRVEALVAPGQTITPPEIARGFIDQILGRTQKVAA